MGPQRWLRRFPGWIFAGEIEKESVCVCAIAREINTSIEFNGEKPFPKSKSIVEMYVIPCDVSDVKHANNNDRHLN